MVHVIINGLVIMYKNCVFFAKCRW